MVGVEADSTAVAGAVFMVEAVDSVAAAASAGAVTADIAAVAAMEVTAAAAARIVVASADIEVAHTGAAVIVARIAAEPMVRAARVRTHADLVVLAAAQLTGISIPSPARAAFPVAHDHQLERIAE